MKDRSPDHLCQRDLAANGFKIIGSITDVSGQPLDKDNTETSHGQDDDTTLP
jgi:hypothetical protein